MRRQQLLMTVSGLVLLVLAVPLWAQQTRLSKVWVIFNKSQDDPRLVSKSGDLFVEESGRKLIVKSEQKPLEVSLDNIQKMLFEASYSARGMGLRAVGGALLAGGVGASLVAGQRVTYYICYFEYKAPDGSMQRYVLEFPEDRQEEVTNELLQTFGEKASFVKFDEKSEEVEKKTLKDLQSKHSVTVDKVYRPLPEIKPDKALVVVVWPATRAREAGRGVQAKIHASDHVVLVTKDGTYSFCYLDPGEYLLVSQAAYAMGIRINLEAGKDYYFTQHFGQGFKGLRVGLTRHSRELVMFYVSGAYYSDWERK